MVKSVQQVIRDKQDLVMIVGNHVRPELESIAPKYSSVFHCDMNHLTSFAALILTEALLSGRIMLRRDDNE